MEIKLPVAVAADAVGGVAVVDAAGQYVVNDVVIAAGESSSLGYK